MINLKTREFMLGNKKGLLDYMNECLLYSIKVFRFGCAFRVYGFIKRIKNNKMTEEDCGRLDMIVDILENDGVEK